MGIETHADNGGGVIGTEAPGQFCTATTLSGKRCRGIPLKGEGLCFAHSERLAEKRKAAGQTAGGRGALLPGTRVVGRSGFENRTFEPGLGAPLP